MIHWFARLWRRIIGLLHPKSQDTYRPSNLHGRHR
jgi:hypothetical protein